MFATAVREKLRLSDALYKQMVTFTKEVSTTVSTGSPSSGEFGGEQIDNDDTHRELLHNLSFGAFQN